MTVLLPWFALVVTILAGWAIIKRLSTSMVLLFAGLAMISFAVICGVHGFLPKGVKPSGFVWFDIFELLRSIATKQTSGIGLLIMVAGGYAAYMDRIGAAHALVRVCVKPLDALSSPYLVLVMGYLIGQALVTVIPSAAGLAMLLLVALFPILRAVGCSAAASAAVIGTSAGMTLGPASGTANLAAQTAGLEPIIYFVQCQLPVAIPTLIVVAICHYFVQKYYDKKNDDVYSDAILTKKDDLRNVPGWYAILPVLPIALMIVFSKLVYSAVKLNTISALLLVWVFTIIVELIRRRDFKPVLADGAFIFKAMGGMFSSIVALIICAEFFATGLKVTGLISALITHAQGMGLGLNGMTAVLTGVVGIVTFLTGSGVGAFSSFAALAPEVANGLGGTAAAFVTPMQFASGMLRAMSPVAGVIIAVAGAAGVISGDTNIDIESTLEQMRASMETMGIGELLGLSIETLLISLCLKIMSILITVILYGRMIEIYCTVSIAPIPIATMSNREWGSIGTNYLKGLFALAFQGFLIMVCVAIYAVLINNMIIAANIHSALFSVAAYTVILCFSLFKTGSLAKSLFNAH